MLTSTSDTRPSQSRRPKPHHLVIAMVGLTLIAGVLLLMTTPGVGVATAQVDAAMTQLPQGDTSVATDLASQLEALAVAMVRLPVATALAAMLAFRPKRSGTPKRQATVIQTQIILAIVGAMVMLVVGASLARAFGIVGAAGLIRYRAKIDDPKDAGVMLSTLAIGLAAGVGLYLFAGFATVFVLGVLWAVESIEPQVFTLFELTVALKDGAPDLRPEIEKTLRRFRVRFELRSTTSDEVSYEVKVPQKRNTETVTKALTDLAPGQEIDVTWDKKKEK